MSMRSVWMLLVVAVIVVFPLLMGGKFEGADGEAAAIVEGTEGFARWFTPIWEPPSGEIASLLFSLQAALGAGVVGYAIGRVHGRRGDGKKDGATPPQA